MIFGGRGDKPGRTLGSIKTFKTPAGNSGSTSKLVWIQHVTPRFEQAYQRLHFKCLGWQPTPMTDGHRAREATLIATDGHTVLGLAYGFMLARGEVDTEVLYGHAVSLPQVFARAEWRGELGFIESIAVAPEARGMNLGNRLVDALVDALMNFGATAIISQAWKTPHGVPIARVFARQGLSPLVEVEHMWRDFERQGDMVCPYCNPNPCSCGAIIYGARLEVDGGDDALDLVQPPFPTPIFVEGIENYRPT